jgi:hypothetical protein
MTAGQKQAALERHRAILLATIDYKLAKQGGIIVYDGEDIVANHFKRQKEQVEEYYKQGQLDKLQLQLSNLTKGLQNRVDLDFAGYIKEKTGYDIDIFDDLRKRVDAIMAQNEVRSQQELNDVGTMQLYIQQTAGNTEMAGKLLTLSNAYANGPGKKEAGYSEVISREVENGVEKVTVHVSTGPKPKHREEQVAISPDGQLRLLVTQWSDGKHASTYVTILFPTASGAIYGTDGIRPDIKAWWKGNSAIVIETRKEYEANTKHKEVRSFDTVVAIEYIEHG